MVPSSCHGVVLAPGNGKCQEMLSLRIVVVPGARWRFTSASSMVRPTSSRTVSGFVFNTATRAFGGIRYVSARFWDDREGRSAIIAQPVPYSHLAKARPLQGN